jgi:hypothetical protein
MNVSTLFGGRTARASWLLDSRTIAGLLVAGQVSALVAIWLGFPNVMDAMRSDLSTADPSVFAPMRSLGYERHAYRFVLSLAVLAMSVAWVRVLRRYWGDVNFPNAVAGIGLIGVTFVLLVLPCRLMFMSTAQRANYAGMRCYVTGSQPRNAPQQYLLYCPDAPAPKVRIVPHGAPGLQLLDFSEGMFSVPQASITIPSTTGERTLS